MYKVFEKIYNALAGLITRKAGSTVQGTYPHPSGTTEADVFALTITKRTIISDVLLRPNNLTKTTIFRAKTKIDATNWDKVGDDLVWCVGDFAPQFLGITGDHDFKVTIQSVEAEGATRDIVYTLTKEEMEA